MRHAPLKMAQPDEGRDDQTNRSDNEHDESSSDKRLSLHDLSHDDKPHELFISEIQRIYQYGMEETLESMSELDMDVLSKHFSAHYRRIIMENICLTPPDIGEFLFFLE